MAYPEITQPALYFNTLWAYRNFGYALARLEILSRFRRSYLGILWAMIQPFMLTLLMSAVLQYVFHQSFAEYSTHVFSGVLVWELISQSIIATSSSILGAGSFIRQARIPIILYPLKSFAAIFTSFLLGLAGCLIWVAIVTPNSISVAWLTLPATCIFLAFCILPLAICSSILGLLFRDFQQTAQLVLVAFYFASPVFFATSVFEQYPLLYWHTVNPVSNLLETLRSPLLHNSLASSSAYMITFGYAVLFYGLAFFLVKKNEARAIYYL